jgi:hypothetical protein
MPLFAAFGSTKIQHWRPRTRFSRSCEGHDPNDQSTSSGISQDVRSCRPSSRVRARRWRDVGSGPSVKWNGVGTHLHIWGTKSLPPPKPDHQVKCPFGILPSRPMTPLDQVSKHGHPKGMDCSHTEAKGLSPCIRQIIVHRRRTAQYLITGTAGHLLLLLKVATVLDKTISREVDQPWLAQRV